MNQLLQFLNSLVLRVRVDQRRQLNYFHDQNNYQYGKGDYSGGQDLHAEALAAALSFFLAVRSLVFVPLVLRDYILLLVLHIHVSKVQLRIAFYFEYLHVGIHFVLSLGDSWHLDLTVHILLVRVVVHYEVLVGVVFG